MANKVKIELRPYDALSILSFMREWVNDSNRNVPEFAAIHETVDAFEQECFKNFTNEHLLDLSVEHEINSLLNRHPNKKQ